ncbi:11151_t:CDS:2, partial [Gigaspora margarita]
MAQCLYFDATLVDLTVIGLDDENENIGNQFIEDVYDMQKILLKSMVSKVDQINIKETGKSLINNLKTTRENTSLFVLYWHYFQVILVSQISGFHIGMVASCWYCDSKKKEIDQEDVIFANSDATARHSKYGEIWSLAWQAVQLAIECDDTDMELWLKCFINQKKHFLIQNEKPKNSEASKTSEDSEDSEKENNSTIENPLIT